jgi:hypothetical protein
LKSSDVVLTRTGGPISSSRDFDELRVRDADRLEVSFSFKHLKSGKSAVEGICGDAEALRACRTTFGDKKVSGEGYVADFGADEDDVGSLYKFVQAVPRYGDDSGFCCVGGTGFK